MDEPIQIERNALDVIETIVSLCCLVGVAVYLLLGWNTFPDRIPGHFNALGEVDRWGSKQELLVLPIISWVIYGIITVVERFPQVWNTGVRVTKENAAGVYRILKNMIAVVKMFVLLMFGSLSVITSQSLRIPIWSIFVFILLLFGTISFFLVRLTLVQSDHPAE